MVSVTNWKRFDAASVQVGGVEKPSKKTCVAPLASPVVLQTCALELSPLVDENGEPLPSVTAKPASPEFIELLKRIEEAVRDQCVARKGEWLKRDADDEEVRQAHKSFVKDCAVKLSVADTCEFFDLSKKPCGRGDVGTHARAILEMTRVVFGKSEFGAVWRVVQLQSARDATPRCMIESDDDSESSDEDNDADLAEFD